MNYNKYVRVRDRRSNKIRRNELNPKLSTGESRYEAPNRKRHNDGTAKALPTAPPWSVHHVKTVDEVLRDL